MMAQGENSPVAKMLIESNKDSVFGNSPFHDLFIIGPGLFDWDIDNSRFRDEAWEQLKIWDLRRKKEIVRRRGSGSVFTKRRTFGRISNELKLTEDLVKKRFYRAHEITQGLKYDIEKNRELWIIRKSELGSECGICEIRDTCADPCPDVLRFIDQDHVAPK
jgi:hypothetical protein